MKVNSTLLSSLLLASLLLGGCASRPSGPPPLSPEQARERVQALLPASVVDRQGWAADIQTALTTQDIAATPENICAVLAVTEQESTFQADPPVPGLARIAREEIDRRAARLRVPASLVDAALGIRSPDGKTYKQRLAAARTEKQLSAIFDDFTGMVPLGQTLFGRFNPVHTGGPMQVSIAFAEQHAGSYPYAVDGSIRREVFSRRGGMYFGTRHLLGYPADYPEPLYRFADFNAGWYASRNAAFQSALSRLTGIELALDGDLIIHDSLATGATERAVRSLGPRLGLNNPAIYNQLKKADGPDFEDTKVYRQVFELAEQTAGKQLPRAILPGITLQSPKITRKLTTAWFAKRVNERYLRCMQRN
ncbi:DUF1615 domain-containing protein [Pseudomonas sp. LJDD11]|nr:DUF1615 domain-containing protein [Pseudomonas sp. LJDD11]